MSIRAFTVAILGGLAGGPITGYVLWPRVGWWCLAFPIIFGAALGVSLAKWDLRSGKHGWWS